MNKKYVSFAEAMKSSKEGKIVRLYDKDGYYNTVFKYEYPINENGIEYNSFKDLLEGKWTIEN
ncbi:hypothetical protein AB1L07_02155 [Niallia alba]|uniref:hypothetical protein n=1 Tax=Niallia alba TaxID=2729105 RepID=UPI0039A2AE52